MLYTDYGLIKQIMLHTWPLSNIIIFRLMVEYLCAWKRSHCHFCQKVPDIGAVEMIACLENDVSMFSYVSLSVGPSVPPAVSYTKRGQALSVESDHREEWDGARRLELSTSKGDVPASPLGVQERKKTTSAVGVRKHRIWLLTNVYIGTLHEHREIDAAVSGV